VTHVLGIRAFGTQLLCEQVIGRALRRQSYELNEEGKFNVEYADIFGIPFDFTAKPVIAPPQPPRETIQVRAISPDRDALETRFPRVEGYRVELPEDRLTADFNDDSVLELSPELVGPSITRNSGIIGQGVDMSLEHLGDMRPSSLVYNLTHRLITTKWREPGEEPNLTLFGQLKRIVKQWLDTCLVCKGGTYPAQLMYQELADMACSLITFKKTSAVGSFAGGTNVVGSTCDYLIWYARNIESIKYRQLLLVKEAGGAGGSAYNLIENDCGQRRSATRAEQERQPESFIAFFLPVRSFPKLSAPDRLPFFPLL
jgi:hypothetical protein